MGIWSRIAAGVVCTPDDNSVTSIVMTSVAEVNQHYIDNTSKMLVLKACSSFCTVDILKKLNQSN